MRRIIIGDVHGCLEELRALLSAVDYVRGEDRLVFVGDLVDRGPDSAGVVAIVRELCETAGAVCLMGNHEVKYVRFDKRVREVGLDAARAASPGFGPAKLGVFQRLTDPDRAWLATRPLYYRGTGYLVVHAGICPRRHRTWPDLDGRRYADRLLRIRNVDAEGKMLRLGEKCPDSRPWFDLYDGRFGHVFFGHQPRDAVVEAPHATGLDTSCCFGGRLTACIFDDSCWGDRACVSVPARGKYALRLEEED